MKKYLALATAVISALMLVSLVPLNKVNAAAKSDMNIVWFTNPDACFAALQAGVVDLMQGALTKTQKEAVEADPNLELAAYADNGMFEFDINNNYTIDDYPTSLNPMYIEKCRQAVAFLVDKNYIISNILSYYGQRIDAPVPYPQTENWVNSSVVTYDWNHDGVIEPSEDRYPYNYNPNQAASLLASLGFNDTDGNGWLNYPNDPMWLDAAGKDTTLMELEVCVRIDDPERLAAGQLLITALESGLAAATWPAHYVAGGWKTTDLIWRREAAILTPKVWGYRNYHIYTGAWSLGRFPTHLFSLFDSSSWYPYGPNYVTGEGPHSPPYRILPHFAHPDLDNLVRDIYYTDSFSSTQTACLKATGYLVQHCVNIPLWSDASYMAWSTNLLGVVNMQGVGLINDYTFLVARKQDGSPINVGVPDTWYQMNPLYSQWYFDYTCLDRISGSLLSVNPLNLAIDQPWMAQDWQVGTWIDPRDGLTKSTCTYYLRKDAGGATPVTGASAGNFKAADYEFSVWYNYRYDDSWQQYNFMDINHLQIINDYTVKVYFEDLSYWFVYAPTYPMIGPASVLSPMLCTTTTSNFLGSDLAANGGQDEYQFTTEGVVHVVSATKNGNPITEGVDFYIRGGYDYNPLHSIFVAITSFAPTDTISITYTYATPDGAGGTYLGSNLGYDWTDTEYCYNTHYPIILSSTAAALNKNPYFFLSPILGELDWLWHRTGTTYPHSGYYKIDIYDAVRFSGAFGTSGTGVYNPRYFPAADLSATFLYGIGSGAGRITWDDLNYLSLTGDFDMDGQITILDLVVMTSRYGTRPGIPPPPGTNPYSSYYDVNLDGLIDILDLVSLTAHYGQKATSQYAYGKTFGTPPA